MIIIAICFVCGLMYDIYIRLTKKPRDEELVPTCLIATILSGLAVLLVVIMVWSFDYGIEYKTISEYELKALSDMQTQDVPVSFICRYDNDGSLVYIAAINTDRGIKLKKYDIDKCYIIEDNSTPRVVEERKRYTNDVAKYILFPVSASHSAIYTFYIPEGSVILDYSVDLN